MAPLPLESATEAMNKINKVMTKVKHTAFGKVKIKKATNNVVDETIDSNDNKNLLEQQRKDVEKEFEHIKNMKLNKVINTLCTASTVDGTKCLTEAAQFFWLDHP